MLTRVEGAVAKKRSGPREMKGGVVGVKGRVEGVENRDVARIFV